MNKDSGLETRPLSHLAVLHREAAEGWLMLGNPMEALAELDELAKEERQHLSVLVIDWRAWTAVGKPGEAWLAAHQWCATQPDSAEAWICQSNSLRELHGSQAAAELLLEIVDRFPSEAVIPYNLACFSAQAHEWSQACAWLVQAFEIDSTDKLKELALIDPDLKPLWDQVADNFNATLQMSVKKSRR